MTYGLGFHTLGCLPTDDLCCHIVPPQSTALSDGSVNISVVRARCEILCECGRSNPMIMVIVLLVYYFTMPVMPNMDVYVMLHDFLLHFIS
jgi:ABC-type amino acid transport system permease subunit